MLKVKARVHLHPEQNGGLTRPGFSSMQPSMDINGDLVACKIIYGEEGTPMLLGYDYDVTVELPYGEIYADKVKRGFCFNLNVASRVVDYGVVE